MITLQSQIQAGQENVFSNAVSRLHIEANKDVHSVSPLNFLQHHMYHNYEHLAQNLYKHKVKQKAQVVVKPKTGYPPKAASTFNKNSV